MSEQDLSDLLADAKNAPPPVDRTLIRAVNDELESTIIALCKDTVEAHTHDSESMMNAAKAIAITFGCWRSLQVELDRAYSPEGGGPNFNLDFGALVEARRRRMDEDEDEEEEDNG